MMTAMMPEVADTARYGVCEAARLLAVDRKTVLNYIKSNLMRHSVNRRTGRKIITGAAIKQTWRIIKG